jgi:putative FmdB family regulatory protein
MPLYDYQCRHCGSELEIRQKFNDAPLTDCPTCATPNVLFRKVQPAPIMFKGGGFYVTDNNRQASTTNPAGKKAESTASDSATAPAPAASSAAD